MKKQIGHTSIGNYLNASLYVRWSILAVVMSIFTVILYPNLIITEQVYNVGDVASRDIKASRDFFVEDKEATEKKRREVVQNVLTVYDFDAALESRINQQVAKAFSLVRDAIETLEQATVMDSAEGPPPQTSDQGSLNGTTIHDHIWSLKNDFEKALGIPVSNGAYKILEKEKFSVEIQNLISQIISEIMGNGVVANKEILLRESQKGITLRSVGTKTEQIETNLKQFYGLDQSKTMVRIVAQPLIKHLNYNLINLIVDFCQRLIQPNITLNRNETEERKKKAAANIEPIMYKIKAGEMLLREGERATPTQLLKLKTMNAHEDKQQAYIKSSGAMLTLLCLLVIIHKLHSGIDRTRKWTNKDVLFFATILVMFLLLPKISVVLFETFPRNAPLSFSRSSMIFGIPMAASAMTVCIFMGLEVGIFFSVIISICTAMIFQNRFPVFIYFFLNCSMGTYWIQCCRERKVFISAGLKLGLLNMLLITVTDIYTGEISGFRFLWDLLFGFCGGIGAGIITAGLTPMMELAFGYTSDITLMELANLERPLLKRLMLEAPGTYHHSVIVGSMVEAAASEIGANPLLAKVCGYYHDIGKINKPLYFIENQANAKNKHDKLAPSMSSLILISHVKHGVEIAREHKLGQVIIDTIKQHHGTSLIKYFYEKAKQLKGEDAVKIEDFRYPGPLPQTREAGLVMLADVVEAASRTLDNPTPSRIQGLVQKLINNIFSDGQLDNCELTLKDLHNIAKSFNKILNGIHHHRIEYEKAGITNGKEKNGRSDIQQTKPSKDQSENNTEASPGHLRRLGVS